MQNPLLSGLRILDLSRLLPGPFCTLYLAQLGAEVVKIEEPDGGDYARSLSPELFALINRGKKSLTLDLRKPDGVAVFKRLAKGSDAVIESFRPGVMDKLGVGYETLKQLNPRLVFCALTGYGQTGPWSARAGHDMNYCSYAGVLDQIGAADGPPALSNVQIADLAGGALTAAIGLLAALLGARASSAGAFVDAAMLDGTLALQALPVAAIRTLGRTQPRGRDMLTGGLPNYGIYQCSDGKHVALAALEPKFFRNFCNAVDRPDLARLPLALGSAGDKLRTELAALFRSRPRDEWDRWLADKDCCVSAILTPDEALANPQVAARGGVRFEDRKPALESPLHFGDAAPVALASAPKLGANTDEVLSAAGLDAAEIKRLRSQHVI